MTDKNTQTEANKRWQEKNREHTCYLRNRSTARSFLRRQATLKDLQEMEQLIVEHKKSLRDKSSVGKS